MYARRPHIRLHQKLSRIPAILLSLFGRYPVYRFANPRRQYTGYHRVVESLRHGWAGVRECFWDLSDYGNRVVWPMCAHVQSVSPFGAV
jgi:hypothetical protein